MRTFIPLLFLTLIVACAHPNPKRDGDQDPDPAVGRTQGSGGAYDMDTLRRDFSNPTGNRDTASVAP